MITFAFVNPFLEAKNVAIIIDNVTYKLDKYDIKYITLKECKRYYYRYLVDDEYTYCPNKLIYYGDDGCIYNYIEFEKTERGNFKFNEEFFNKSYEMRDIDVIYNCMKIFDGIENKILLGSMKMAADNGHIDAMYEIGYNSFAGTCKKNYDDAKKYLKMASDYGHPRAMLQLGTYYKYKEKNMDEAIKYFKLSADQNYSHGINAVLLHAKYIDDPEYLKKFSNITDSLIDN